MDTYEVELEPAAPEGFVGIVPAVPGLLVLGSSMDEVLERARAAIEFRVCRAGRRPAEPIRVAPRPAAKALMLSE